MASLREQVEDLMRWTIGVLSSQPGLTATAAREGLEQWDRLDPEVFLPKLGEVSGQKFSVDDIQAYTEAQSKDIRTGNQSGAASRIRDALRAKELTGEWHRLLHSAVVIARGVEGKEKSFGTTTREDAVALNTGA